MKLLKKRFSIFLVNVHQSFIKSTSHRKRTPAPTTTISPPPIPSIIALSTAPARDNRRAPIELASLIPKQPAARISYPKSSNEWERGLHGPATFDSIFTRLAPWGGHWAVKTKFTFIHHHSVPRGLIRESWIYFRRLCPGLTNLSPRAFLCWGDFEMAWLAPAAAARTRRVAPRGRMCI